MVEEEDLAEDLGWDATGGGEGVAAGTDGAQRETDGGHLSIDEVERRRVCEGGGKDPLDDVVDEGNARLDDIGPVLGGSGARDVCGHLIGGQALGLVGGLEDLQYIVLCVWVVHWQKTKKRSELSSIARPGRHVLPRTHGPGSNQPINIYIQRHPASHSKGIVYYLAGVIPLV